MLSVQKMHDDLDYWIHIGLGDDIVSIPDHRPEYQHLVKRHKAAELSEIPKLVLADLKLQLTKPWYQQRTFWVLLMRRAKARITRK